MTNISKAQSQINREHISRLLEKGLSHDQIIEQLQLSRSSFYAYLKRIRAIETRIWSKVEIDNAKYRGLALLRSFEETDRVCTNIANNPNTSNKDKIEACKARDMAKAHAFRLVNEGTMFQHLPEVRAYVQTALQNNSNNEPHELVYHNDTEADDNDSSTEDVEIDNIDNNSNSIYNNNINNNNNNNNNKLSLSHSSSSSSSIDDDNNE